MEQQRKVERDHVEREARERHEAEYAKRPEVIAERRDREIRRLRNVVADWASEPRHPRAVAARKRLEELEAEAAAA